MITIKNYNKLQNKNFVAKTGQPGWIVSNIIETEYEYQIAVMPWKEIAYSIQHAIVYTLSRVANSHTGRYTMINNKTGRRCSVMKSNLTLSNFLLELGIQVVNDTQTN